MPSLLTEVFSGTSKVLFAVSTVYESVPEDLEKVLPLLLITAVIMPLDLPPPLSKVTLPFVTFTLVSFTPVTIEPSPLSLLEIVAFVFKLIVLSASLLNV